MVCNWKELWTPSLRTRFIAILVVVTLFIVYLPEYSRSVFPVDLSSGKSIIKLPIDICKEQNKKYAKGLEMMDLCGGNFTGINTTVLGKKYKNFRPTIIKGQYVGCPLIRTMEALIKVLKEAQIPYFIHSGTLLGSWRHHGFFPWDHDMDIAVPWSSKPNLTQVFRTLTTGLQIVKRKDIIHWKFLSNESRRLQNPRFSFVVDVFFYHEQHGKIVIKRWPCQKFPRHWIFPVTYRPFNHLQLASPAKPDLVMKQCFPHYTDICVIGHSRVNCTQLQSVYPFVRRAKVQGQALCKETLMFNGSVLSTFVGNYSC